MKELAIPLIILGMILAAAGIFLLFSDRLPFNFGRRPAISMSKGKKALSIFR